MCYISSETKMLKPQLKTEVEIKSDEKKSIIAKVNPSLYKKLIIDDLTNTGMRFIIVLCT